MAWYVTLRVTDCRTRSGIAGAQVNRYLVNEHGESVPIGRFRNVDGNGEIDIESEDGWPFFVVLLRQAGYIEAYQPIYKESDGETVTFCLEPTPPPTDTTVPPPTDLWVDHWSEDGVALSWKNPRQYSKMLVGWNKVGAAHRDFHLDGSPQNATIQARFDPGAVYDLKVKGAVRKATPPFIKQFKYSDWTVVRWTYPEPRPPAKEKKSAPPPPVLQGPAGSLAPKLDLSDLVAVRNDVTPLRPALVGSQTAAVSWGPDRIDVFYRQPGLRARGVGHTAWNGSRWNSDVIGDQNPVAGVAAASRAPNRLDVFYTTSPTKGLWHIDWNGRRWGQERNLGGELISAGRSLSAISWGPDRIDVFYAGPDKQLVQRFYQGGQWSDEVDLGFRGLVAGRPAVLSRGINQLDVFFRGADDQLHQVMWDGSRWTHARPRSHSPGARMAGDPAAVHWVSPEWGYHIVVLYRGPRENLLWHDYIADRWRGPADFFDQWKERFDGLSALPSTTTTPRRLNLFYTGRDHGSDVPGEQFQLWHRRHQWRD